MPFVEAASLAGTSIFLEACDTVGDVMVKIAVLNQRLATEIAIVNPICGTRLKNFEGTPLKVNYMILDKEDVDEIIPHFLKVNLILHAEQNDIPTCALMLEKLRFTQGPSVGHYDMIDYVKNRKRNWKVAMLALMEVGVSGAHALIYAVTYENLEAFDALLSHPQFREHCNLHRRCTIDGVLACVVHVKNSELRLYMTNALIAAGASPDVISGRMRPVLAESAGRGFADIVEILLAARANINAKSERGRTALIEASLSGFVDVVTILLGAGADIEVRDESTYSALVMASSKGHVEVVEALVAAGADIFAADKYGRTAESFAQENVEHIFSREMEKKKTEERES